MLGTDPPGLGRIGTPRGNRLVFASETTNGELWRVA